MSVLNGETETGDNVTFIDGQAVDQQVQADNATSDQHADELSAAKAAAAKAIAEYNKKNPSADDSDESAGHVAPDKDDKKPKPAPKSGKSGGDSTGSKSSADKDDNADKGSNKDANGNGNRDASGRFAKANGEPAGKTQTSVSHEGEAKQPPKAVNAPDEEPAPDSYEQSASKLRKALSDRTNSVKQRMDAQAQLEADRAEARRVYQEYQRKAAEIEQERAKYAKFRTDPVTAMRESGLNAEEFILTLANHGTPEGQRAAAERARQDEIRQIREWQQNQERAAAQYRQQQEQAQRQNFRTTVEQEFLKTAGAKGQDGKHVNPHLVAMYKDDAEGLIAQADMVADRYRKKTGQEASFHDIVEYLEEKHSRVYKSMYQASSMPASAPQVGAPVTKVSGQGSSGKRTLTPDASGERRSLGKNISDLDGEERLAEAKRQANEAIARAVANQTDD